MATYLQYFPKPFLDDLVGGRCIPFVGAGFSRNANIPKDAKMLDWDGLGKHFAALLPPGDNYKGAVEAISSYAYEYSRVKLVEEMTRTLIIAGVEPGETHQEFCRLPFDVVCTTNLEFLLERGYTKENIYCRPIIDEEQLGISSDPEAVTLIKMHGDIHHPTRMVVTEDDYDSFLERYPLLSTYMANMLITKTALFIGYSLDDPDFRQIWQLVGDRLGKLRRFAYTLAVAAPAHVIARYERRGVKVISIPGNPAEYAVILRDVFAELREYWTSSLIKGSKSTEEESMVELSLPKEAKTRLCYFAIPMDQAAFYRSHVFPIAEKHGFAPMTAHDVSAPGDSAVAKISALVERADVFVLSDNNKQFNVLETRMVLARAEDSHLLIVGSVDQQLTRTRLHLIRPQNPDEYNAFLAAVEAWFEEAAEALRPTFAEEPKRLLRKGEGRAAVVSAYTLLEHELRKYLTEAAKADVGHQPLSIRNLLNTLSHTQHNINGAALKVVSTNVAVRNFLVHTADEISTDQAEKIVNAVYTVLRGLQSLSA